MFNSVKGAAPRAIRGAAWLRIFPMLGSLLTKINSGSQESGSCAPVSVLIDERSDGVHLSCDTMMSPLAAYGNTKALEVARELDAKRDKPATEAARS
jgi:hypothetical protein